MEGRRREGKRKREQEKEETLNLAKDFRKRAREQLPRREKIQTLRVVPRS